MLLRCFHRLVLGFWHRALPLCNQKNCMEPVSDEQNIEQNLAASSLFFFS
jgi:hypothetical protein